MTKTLLDAKTLLDDCFKPSDPRLKHDDALALLKSRLSVMSSIEKVILGRACGRITAHDIECVLPVPRHTNSAVDGYAFASRDYDQALGSTLLTVGRAAAGHPVIATPIARQAVRILTGAVMPVGLDTVVMQEDVELGEKSSAPTITIPAGLKAGANVRHAGEDLAVGAKLCPTGHILRPQDLAALASIGQPAVNCFAKLKVAIVSTGDEVVSVSGPPAELGQVYDANADMLVALCANAGVDATHLGIWPDQLQVVTDRLASTAQSFDVIITSGGASMGEEDHMAKAIDTLGQRHLWQLAIKPGRPMMFGQIRSDTRDTIIIGLPGNPVAVFVCFLMYVHPMLRRLGGANWPEPRRFMIPAAFGFANRKVGRREFWRGNLVLTPDGMKVDKFARDGSGLISGLRAADGLIEIPEDHGDVVPGMPVAYIPFTEFGIPAG
jgi:molybdopterin molybdotransferase